MNAIGRVVTGLIALTGFSPAFAQAPEFNSELTAILTRFAASAPADASRQVTEAIQASDTLTRRLNDLAASGALTAVELIEVKDLPGIKNIFRAIIDDRKILITPELLKELEKKRLFDVAHDNDILPNNATFVLSHLAYHLATTEQAERDMRESRDPDTYTVKMLRREALAFIQSWNDTVDAAMKENGGKPLTPGQQAQLLLNARYRFAIITVKKPPEETIQYLDSGMVEPTEHNINVVRGILNRSNVTDIE